jgi:squalene-hopene/tetraprenyl-beta-curcumene cyclase
MALACAGEKHHPCVPDAVRFLINSQRSDGAWPIDTNLATWVTTLSVRALGDQIPRDARAPLKTWLRAQQYKTIHPFTNAAPGGWAWTDLPGGVPDADDSSGALIALWHLCESDDERRELLPAIEAGITWLLDLQNRDGGMPTFCRGWGTLPFDRSTPEITAHAFAACKKWLPHLVRAGRSPLTHRCLRSLQRAMLYLQKTSNSSSSSAEADGGWIPLWFGNEHTPEEENVVFGSARVLHYILAAFGPSMFEVRRMVRDVVLDAVGKASSETHRGRDASLHLLGKLVEPSGTALGLFFVTVKKPFAALQLLLERQNTDGGWGGDKNCPSSIEETAVTVEAIARLIRCSQWPQWVEPGLQRRAVSAIEQGAVWLMNATQNGTQFPAAPIGLYFAKLWYHEKMYPIIWALGALRQAKAALAENSSNSA